MSSRDLLLLLALCVPAIAQCSGLAANQPLSSWHTASADDKRQLVNAIVSQLRNTAGITTPIAVPMDTIVKCVDGNHTRDTLHIHDQDVKVTAGLAVVLCVKIHIPRLQKARYVVHGS